MLYSAMEQVNTIMRYLLEELNAYEEGFSDIMMEGRASERHESFMGVPDPSASPTKHDLHTFGENIIQKFEGLFQAYANTPGREKSPIAQPTQPIPANSMSLISLPYNQLSHT